MGVGMELIYYPHPSTQAVGKGVGINEGWVGDRARLVAPDPIGSEKF